MIFPADNTVRAYLRARAASDQHAAMMAHLFACDRIAEGRLEAARNWQATQAEHAALAWGDLRSLIHDPAAELDMDLSESIERRRRA
jgi:hypothetical protein